MPKTTKKKRRSEKAESRFTPGVIDLRQASEGLTQPKNTDKSVATKSTAASSSSGTTRLTEYKTRSERARRAERDYAKAIVPALAARSYHIPGNSYCQDLMQYFTNNHPVFGLFCHHRLHPVRLCQRIVILIGSIAFGLVVSNLIYLYFIYNTDEGVDGVFVSVQVSANVTVAQFEATPSRLTLTNYQVVLWTAGGAAHSMFDLSIWYITACACCQVGGSLECLSCFSAFGSYLVMFTVVTLSAAATFVVVLRAALDGNDIVNLYNTTGGLFDDEIQLIDTLDDTEAFRFLLSWCIETVLALFVYNLILGTLLFSGILGCYRLPFLGGRPREIYLEEKEAEVQRSKTQEEEDWETP